MLYSWETNGEYAPRWKCDHCGTIFAIPWGTKSERVKFAIKNNRQMMCSTKCMEHRGVQPLLGKHGDYLKVVEPLPIGQIVKKKKVKYEVVEHLPCLRSSCNAISEYRKIINGDTSDYKYCQTCKLYTAVSCK